MLIYVDISEWWFKFALNMLVVEICHELLYSLPCHWQRHRDGGDGVVMCNPPGSQTMTQCRNMNKIIGGTP